MESMLLLTALHVFRILTPYIQRQSTGVHLNILEVFMHV